jgi:putative FmdB family regulatory protein
MPLYDMICGECKFEFEVQHSMNESHPKECPKCGALKAQQHFKKAPAAPNTYSPLHPRRNRGRGY